jgi:FkbM family methyltransferase
MSSSTFFGEKIYYRLPEHFYFLFSSFFPEVNSTNERNLTVYLIRNLKKETTFFDIGANCGFYTLLAYHLMEGKGHVHAFEPTPQIVALLRKSVKKFPNIIVNQVAVSDSRGQADFYLNKFSVGNTMDVHYVLNSFLEFSKISVPTISIDEYCQINKTYPDFIKIDVEGSEGKVIEGALDMIAVKHPIIAMEVWKDPIFSHKKAVSQLF